MAKQKPTQTLQELVAAYDGVALVLQGGGALGSYQVGVYEALAEHDIYPSWVAGVSIGAINAALIAGNAPERRSEALHGFWNAIASPQLFGPMQHFVNHFAAEGDARVTLNQLTASLTILTGQPHFFQPRVPPAWLHRPGTVAATSFYDTKPLRATLERFVDFDRLNSGAIRVSLGAVNVETGNFCYFDSDPRAEGKKLRIRPEHIMASGALPPGFPAVEIDGQHYWDGGVVSNTPLQYVLEERPRRNMLVFQVDLWTAKGKMPRDLLGSDERRKDIAYSSRTRLNTDAFKYEQKLRNNIHSLLEKLPPSLHSEPEFEILRQEACPARTNIIHLVYQQKMFERDSKDYEFSELTMHQHWHSGHDDTTRTLKHIDWFKMPPERVGTVTHDLHRQ
jgi:NTE family protein